MSEDLNQEKIKEAIITRRPHSIAELAEWTLVDPERFIFHLGNFLDHYYAQPSIKKLACLKDEPMLLTEDPDRHYEVPSFFKPTGSENFSDYLNAFFGATAEHLSLMLKKHPPAWVDHPARFLHRAYFDNQGFKSLNATLLVESPLAFRKRMIFTEQKPLRRA